MTIQDIKNKATSYRKLYNVENIGFQPLVLEDLARPQKSELNSVEKNTHWLIKDNYTKNRKDLNLSNSIFKDMKFSQCLIERAVFLNCQFDTVTFKDSKFRNAIFINCDFKDCIFSSVNLDYSFFDACYFEEVQMYASQLNESLFLDSNYKDIDICMDDGMDICFTDGLVNTTRESITQSLQKNLEQQEKRKKLELEEDNPLQKNEREESSKSIENNKERKENKTMEQNILTIHLDNSYAGEGLDRVSYTSYSITEKNIQHLSEDYDLRGKTFIRCVFENINFFKPIDSSTKFISCEFKNCHFKQPVTLSYNKGCRFIDNTEFESILSNTYFEDCTFKLVSQQKNNFLNLRFRSCKGDITPFLSGQNCIQDEQIEKQEVTELRTETTKVREDQEASENIIPKNQFIELLSSMTKDYSHTAQILSKISKQLQNQEEGKMQEKKVYVTKVLTEEEKMRIAYFYFKNLDSSDVVLFTLGQGKYANLKPYTEEKQEDIISSQKFEKTIDSDDENKNSEDIQIDEVGDF
ncbi:pentapeptide repeat-containing protein [Eggerthia catenaformis]|uniref:pentapeptide repeat-containing protein n=1 Tax=Eggerthia catenaformis TaxID=31973 RepID=UPI00248EB54B|nr:pentapeptide repeat-containing protein [Eggerthia catenaformis]